MQIIPALYIQDGKLAIYGAGNYQKIEHLDQDPYQLINRLVTMEFERVHLVDVDAVLGTGNNRGFIGSLCNTSLADLEVRGGIDDENHLKSLRYAGVDYFVLGSVTFTDFDFLKSISEATYVRNERVTIAMDVMDGKLVYNGFQEEADITPKDLMKKCQDLGFTRFLCTDADAEKYRHGPNLAFYEKLVKDCPDCMIAASGRLRTLADVERLEALGVQECVVGNEIFQEDDLLRSIALFNKTRK